jgi:hypothetical protein
MLNIKLKDEDIIFANLHRMTEQEASKVLISRITKPAPDNEYIAPQMIETFNIDVSINGIDYEARIDEVGNDYIRSYNEQYDTLVQLAFVPAMKSEATQEVLDILKRDYLAKGT